MTNKMPFAKMPVVEFKALSRAEKAAAWRRAGVEHAHAADDWNTEAQKAEAAADTARRLQREAEMLASQCLRNASFYEDAAGADDALRELDEVTP